MIDLSLAAVRDTFRSIMAMAPKVKAGKVTPPGLFISRPL